MCANTALNTNETFNFSGNNLDLETFYLSQLQDNLTDFESYFGQIELLHELKKYIIHQADLDNAINTVVKDPALAAYMLWRTNCANGYDSNVRPRTLREGLIRLGLANIYKLAFLFYFRDGIDELPIPYLKLVKGYWIRSEAVADQASMLYSSLEDLPCTPDELQTLSLFSHLGEILIISKFADENFRKKAPLSFIKSFVLKHGNTVTLKILSALFNDSKTVEEMKIALSSKPHSGHSAGTILYHALENTKKLIKSNSQK